MTGTRSRVGRLPKPWPRAFCGRGALLRAVAVLGAVACAGTVAAAEASGDLELIPQPTLVERCGGALAHRPCLGAMGVRYHEDASVIELTTEGES